MNLRFSSLSLGALLLAGMASCSNDVENKNVPADGNVEIKLQKQPDFYVYAGQTTLLNTLGSKSGEPETAETPNEKYTQKEVEINLSVNDVHLDEEGEAKYDIEDLVSKLSVHVRCATDVEVVLPIPASIYCDQDDFAVFGNHEGVFPWSGEEVTKTINVGEKTVTLAVSFEESQIKITTQGVDAEVIAYCNQQFEDGLNIEIYNYYKDQTVESLKSILDGSTVKFATNDNVDLYVNAFASNEEGTAAFGQDCKVVPAEEGVFGEPEEGEHLNGSKFNKIYSKVVEE